MAQVGDIVRFLNSVGGGKITKIEGNIAYVEDDGFETPVLLKECVVITPVTPSKKTESKYVPPMTVLPQQPKPTEVEETPDGDKLNIVLAYEAEEIKHLTTTEYDTYLVNDSNYFLYFTYLTRADGHDWVTRFAGIVEPNYQEHLEHLTRDQIQGIDRVAIQYIAFKRDKEFKLKAPVAVEYPVDNTKFFKLHCFRDNVYFDTPVIAFDIVKNDIPQRSMVFDSGNLEDTIASKKKNDIHPSSHKAEKRQKKAEVIEIDLHIHELLESTTGLTNTDMLNVQLAEFHKTMQEHIKHKGQKIVFIHGKGEGVLRNALLKELRYRYKTCEVQDASFREYGFGATQVTIH